MYTTERIYVPMPGPCLDRNHYPPSHMVFPDTGYRHVCPACGQTQIVFGHKVTC